MNVKFFVIFSFIVQYPFVSLLAQVTFFPKIGISFNSIGKAHSNNYIAQPELGFSVALIANIPSNDRININSGIELIKKNFSYIRNDPYTGIQERSINSYLQLPLNIEICLIRLKNIQLNTGAGAFAGYLVRRKRTGFVPNIFNSESYFVSDGDIVQNLTLNSYKIVNGFNSKKDKRSEVGLSTNINIIYKHKSFLSPFVDFSFCHSLTNIEKKYMLKQKLVKNSTYCFSLGFRARMAK